LDFFRRLHELEASFILVGTCFIAVTALLNICYIILCRPRRVAKLSGDMSIGLGLLAWILHATAPGAEELRNLISGLWFLTESNYMLRMCCKLSNGRVYFWGSIALALFSSMFMAALQSDVRPTLAKMILAGLPPSAFFISCAARIMPNVIGVSAVKRTGMSEASVA
jgi:hypothetical protein